MCQHIIFWPGIQRPVYCHTKNLEPNWRVTINRVPFKKHEEHPKILRVASLQTWVQDLIKHEMSATNVLHNYSALLSRTHAYLCLSWYSNFLTSWANITFSKQTLFHCVSYLDNDPLITVLFNNAVSWETINLLTDGLSYCRHKRQWIEIQIITKHLSKLLWCD